MTYASFLEYLYLIIAILFLAYTFNNALIYVRNKKKIVLFYSLTCFVSSIYTITLFYSLKCRAEATSQRILISTTLLFVLGNLGWLFYLKTLSKYLRLKIKNFKYIQWYYLVFSILFFMDLLCVLVQEKSVFFTVLNEPSNNLFLNITNMAIAPTAYAYPFYLISALIFFPTLFIVLKVLSEQGRNEKWLLLGLSISFLASINDLVIDTGLFYWIFPIGPLAFFIEMFRFNFLFQTDSFSQIDYLEDEIIKYSKLAEIGTLASGINHDIRNSLAAIKLYAQRIKKTPNFYNDGSDKILESSNKINEIIGVYSNLIYHNSTNLEEIQLSKILNESLNILSNDAIEKGVNDIKLDVESNIYIQGHYSDLTLIFMNLLKNSIQAISKNEEKWIKVYTEEKNGFISVFVQDSGNGIATQLQDKIFQRQFTTKKQGEGTGLGLYLIKVLVAKSDGDISLVKDAPTTTFKISLKKC